MKNTSFLKIALFTIAFFTLPDLFAQCPMCKMAAQSNLQNGGTAGAGLNFGILYILSLPYLLVLTIGYLWWRNRKKNVDDNENVVGEEMQFSEN